MSLEILSFESRGCSDSKYVTIFPVAPQAHIEAFVQDIWQFFDENRRDLPWRNLEGMNTEGRSYRVLVSEIMLQQTQVARVSKTFICFIHTFPDFTSLSHASNQEVLLAWRGMGYNRRALALRDAACDVCDRFSGSLPHDMDALLSMKGIGPYTAAAIRNFAFFLPTPCLDINIRRVLVHRFFRQKNGDSKDIDDQTLLAMAKTVLSCALSHESRTPADWHNALMDYGSLALPIQKTKRDVSKEPGRIEGNTYIPNRIFRGRVIEALRDVKDGLTFQTLGRKVCRDWVHATHREWLLAILQRLEKEKLISKQGMRYLLGT